MSSASKPPRGDHENLYPSGLPEHSGAGRPPQYEWNSLICRTNERYRHAGKATDTHLAALLVHLVNGLDRVQVVDAGIQTNLVHDDDPRLLDLILELADPGADVARRDNVRLALDRGLDDVDVVDVRDERDDEVVVRDGLLERGGVGHVERYASRVGEVGG